MKGLVEISIERSEAGRINFGKTKSCKGWYDNTIFHKLRNGINIPNELGKKIGVHFLENGGSANLYFNPTQENIALVNDALIKKDYTPKLIS